MGYKIAVMLMMIVGAAQLLVAHALFILHLIGVI